MHYRLQRIALTTGFLVTAFQLHAAAVCASAEPPSGASVAERVFQKLEKSDFWDSVESSRNVASETPQPAVMPELPADLRFERAWQAGKQCGPVAVFLLLRTRGIDAQYADVAKLIKVGEQGASMAELQQAAGHYGLQCRVVQFSAEDVAALPRPCIIHYNPQADASAEDDHFDVLLQHREGSGYVVIDTTNATVSQLGYRSFVSRISGYALIVVTPLWVSVLRWIVALILAVDAILLCWLLARCGLSLLHRTAAGRAAAHRV